MVSPQNDGNGASAPVDIALYGATGFVGGLIARHLAEHAPPGVRIALAGRSEAKLAATRAALPTSARDWPLIVADAADPAATDRLAAGARVVLSTVGPYAKYGLGLVGSCARAGTHYADLTGEVLFVREAIDRFHDTARASGARIVHSCGYDSVPSDLGVFLAHRAAQADGAGGLTEVRTVATMRGGVSGGTVDSLRGQLDTVRTDRDARRLAARPHSLSPNPSAEPTPSQPGDAGPPARLPDGTWTAPFVMASYNTRIVRRSNALLDHAYGRGLRYGELQGCGRGVSGAVTAGVVTGGLGALVGAFMVPPIRPLLDRVLPAPGTGPSERTRERGWFRMDVRAETESGRRYRVRVSGPGDPGYGATAVMFGEAGLALALGGSALPDRAGCLTPATALGDVLVDRLRAAGHTYDVAAG
ncbi:trans-acting enoyl reductase family protein [Pseudonocardia sp. McavD-2-B]|uniref:saccharopine dehydrogenase family protein n=1 Tax=Pseudonocardia sp. McavD-2-B TaxID=2954499 RepID=UPI002097AAF9|nr:saccharopine dehydrogenase NADP-binding domain-containing protein [Pseudonocardia sp. McavD-2-B]MCO7192125.1 saccharopine dehydrogenase NADP-binding domain-containing protein [Pseudonocardia sp. McavD-2-B]